MPSRFVPTLLVLLLAVPRSVGQPAEPAPRPQTLPPPPPLSPSADVPVLPPPAPRCAPPLVEKTVPYGQLLLVPCERATTLPRWALREVEVGRGPGGPVLTFHEEKRTVTELELRPREVEQQVTCTESKPQTVTDPCTGRCHTVYQPCEVVKTVKVKVYETVPVQREVIVRVPTLKPGPEVVVKKLVLDTTTVPAVETTYRAVLTPGEVSVLVPGCPASAGPACPAPRHP